MARTEAQDRYDKENMAYQTVKVRRELLDSFKAACAANGDKVNTILREAMEQYVSKKQKEDERKEKMRAYYRDYYKNKRRKTQEQKDKFNAYLRDYRAKNRDKVKQWRDNYTIRKAERLMAERADNKEE